jgi:hypothetical protein
VHAAPCFLRFSRQDRAGLRKGNRPLWKITYDRGMAFKDYRRKEVLRRKRGAAPGGIGWVVRVFMWSGEYGEGSNKLLQEIATRCFFSIGPLWLQGSGRFRSGISQQYSQRVSLSWPWCCNNFSCSSCLTEQLHLHSYFLQQEHVARAGRGKETIRKEIDKNSEIMVFRLKRFMEIHATDCFAWPFKSRPEQ